MQSPIDFFDEKYKTHSLRPPKDPARPRVFVIDDRNAGDHNARGRLYPVFCSVFLEIKNSNEFTVILGGQIPVSDEVRRLLPSLTEDINGMRARVTVTPESVSVLEDLATAFERIVAPGQPRYSVPSYKYACPRTATTLRRFAESYREYLNSARPS
jgi:hypothetical protein